MTDIQQLLLPVTEEMNSCREQLEAFMSHSNPLLNEVLRGIAQHKGKMLRPLLTLLSAKLFAPISQETISMALTFEFFHTATLVHDDVVDESDERRGVPSVNKAYSNKVAVLVGDYLLANALHATKQSKSIALVGIISQAAKILVDGEFLQLKSVYNREISEKVYYHIIKGKTAALFEACAQAGALSVGAQNEDVETMRLFGEKIGMCFQIKDDIFDYMTDAHIGKPTGNDMREGKLTLPVIYALEKVKDAQMLDLAYKVKDRVATSDEIAQLVAYTLDNGGIEYAVKTMEQYADEARRLLDKYPQGEVKTALLHFVDYVIERTY